MCPNLSTKWQIQRRSPYSHRKTLAMMSSFPILALTSSPRRIHSHSLWAKTLDTSNTVPLFCKGRDSNVPSAGALSQKAARILMIVSPSFLFIILVAPRPPCHQQLGALPKRIGGIEELGAKVVAIASREDRADVEKTRRFSISRFLSLMSHP